VKTVHLLVPQVEHGLRSIVNQLGKPVTKAHPVVKGVSVSINMGDILYSKDIGEALGPILRYISWRSMPIRAGSILEMNWLTALCTEKRFMGMWRASRSIVCLYWDYGKN